MNPNNQPPKVTDGVKNLAKEVIPLVKNFVKEQSDARKERQAQQQQYDQPRTPKQPIAARIENAINKFLQSPNGQNNNQKLQVHQQPAFGGRAYEQQPYGQQPHAHQRRRSGQNQNQAPQAREVEIRECLKAHNDARRTCPGRSRPDLKWDERLATHAQRYAEHLARHDLFEHDFSGTGEGENLYMKWGSGVVTCTFKEAVEAWNTEIVHYRGQQIGKGDLSKYGHYTQNIWPKTTHVGMARGVGKNGKHIIVARYSPPGNVMGKTAYE